MYPFDSLAIITPKIFFILLIAFPLIGFFAGWKRALYWGGGNFVFYIIGLVIWKLAGIPIAQALEPIVKNVLGDRVAAADLSQLVNSVVTPAFFLFIILVANLVLVICYYAFAKRLLGLKKAQKQEKEDYKKYKVDDKKLKALDDKKVYNKKWFNRLVGSISLGALMLPITLTTTQAVAMMTTNTKTRQNNSFTSGLYNGLQGVSGSMWWFSFYNGQNTGKDYDALFSLIALNQSTLTYTDPVSGESVTADPVTATSTVLSKGMDNVIKTTKSATDFSSDKVDAVTSAINGLSYSWDDIMNKCGGDLTTLFNSSGITKVIETLICEKAGSKIVADENLIKNLTDSESVYTKMLEAYTTPKPDGKYWIEDEDGGKHKITPIQKIIETSREAFDNIVQSIYSMYDVSKLNEEQKTVLKSVTTTQVQMFLIYK